GNVAISNTNPGEVGFGSGCGFTLIGNTIGGNVSIANSNGSSLFVILNFVGKNMSITENLASIESMVLGNKCAGNLACSWKVLAPSLDDPAHFPPNTAKKLIGQCAE